MRIRQYIIQAARQAKRKNDPNSPLGNFKNERHRKMFKMEYERYIPRKTKRDI